MRPIAVLQMPIVANVCEQVLREMTREKGWSLAHVTMNPLALSLLHQHHRMTEIYVVTRGFGILTVGRSHYEVAAGSVHRIPAGVPHMLLNKSGSHLEHLVFALPPFNPDDVEVLRQPVAGTNGQSLELPKVVNCFDGAKILPYEFPNDDLSVAFGWVSNDPTRVKEPHYHKETTEWIYVVDGKGEAEIDGVHSSIERGSWLKINPGTLHALRNREAEDMVVVCICTPKFNMDDVYYRNRV